MSRARMYIAGSVLVAVAVGASLALFASGAGAAPASKTVQTFLSQRPDTTNSPTQGACGDSLGGYVWALDTMKRTTSITQVSPGNYRATVTDKGTFQAFATSDNCIAASIPGNLNGGFVEDFQATPNFAGYTGGARGHYTGSEPASSGGWLAYLFAGDPAFSGSIGDYSWTYAATDGSGDVMVQDTAGVTGAING
jgi:hypothetical protein